MHICRTVAGSSAVVLALSIIVGGQPPGPGRVRETPDVALRRAQAFHDMYAAPPDKAVLAQRRAAGRAGVTARSVRALPINYGSFDPEFRLRPLTREGRIRPGAPSTRGRGRSAPASPLAPTWQNIGPTNVAGRVSALAVDPANPAVIYRGAAGGGVWVSKNGGAAWTPLTDTLGDLSIGAIALGPAQPGKPAPLYVGTGEGALGIDGIDGIGLIKSTDGGATWNLPVAVPGRRFFALSVNPTKADEIVAATLNGIQKSTDGGATWITKLQGTAATDIVRIPGAPSRMIAAAWDVSAPNATWTGSIYRSVNGGDTWTKATGAGTAPFDADTGRISLAVSARTPAIVYALGATASGDSKDCPDSPVDQVGVFQSLDEGATWKLKSNPVTGSCSSEFESILGSQGWYANVIRVDPASPTTVYAGGLDVWKSVNGGSRFTRLSRWDLEPTQSKFVHADIHALAFSGTTLLVGDDGGVQKTTNGGSTFSSLNTGIVTRQYYAIGISNADRLVAIAGAQDNGTNIRVGGGTTYREVIGGDGFGVAAHPTNPKILYGTVYDSRVFRSRDGGSNFTEVTPRFGASEKRPFISPLTMDPKQPDTLYTGSNFLYKTTNGGTSWTKTSSTDLGDNNARGYLTRIAVAPSDTTRLLTATGGGVVKKSNDGGATWTKVNGLPSGYASHVEFDPVNPEVFYVTFTNAGPIERVLKTTNNGQSFKRIDNGLPPFPAHVLRVHPKNTNTLYVGTDVGLYISLDGGTTWKAAGQGLPAVSIWDLAIFPDGLLTRVATHGRGIYELLTSGRGRTTN